MNIAECLLEEIPKIVGRRNDKGRPHSWLNSTENKKEIIIHVILFPFIPFTLLEIIREL